MLVVVVASACIPDRVAPPPSRSTPPVTPATEAVAGQTVAAPTGAVVLLVDFESVPVGAFGTGELAATFGTTGWSQGLAEGRAWVVASERGKSLRVRYPRGSVGPGEGGAQFLVSLPGAHDELYCRYRVRFGDGFDFVKGGKLPGLVGGSHPTGGRPADDGFSARLMWRTGGAVVQYLYHPHQSSKYGVDLPYTLHGEARFQPGVWHTVTHRIVMNRPGASDGIIQAWFDGKLALDKRDALLRLDDTVHVDALYVSTFFGGNEASWAAARDEVVDFDDFIVSTKPPPP